MGNDRFASSDRDTTGFVAHMRWRSIVVPTGIALIVLSLGVASFLMLLPSVGGSDARVLATTLDKFVENESDDVLDLNFTSSHIVATLAFVGLVFIGIVILAYARNDRVAYMEAFPHVTLAFTDAERAEGLKVRARCNGVGLALWGVGAAAFAVLKVLGLGHAATGCLLCVGALGTWVIIHGGMRAKREDVYAYNFEALKQSSYYSLNAETKGPNREWVLGAKRISMLAQTQNRIVLCAGALVSLALYSLPTLATPYWWAGIALAGLLALLNTHRAMVRSRSLPGAPQ